MKHNSYPHVLTTGEVARLLGVGAGTVMRWIDRRRLRGFRIPGARDRRVRLESLLAFCRQGGVTSPELDALAVACGLEPRPTPALLLVTADPGEQRWFARITEDLSWSVDLFAAVNAVQRRTYDIVVIDRSIGAAEADRLAAWLAEHSPGTRVEHRIYGPAERTLSAIAEALSCANGH